MKIHFKRIVCTICALALCASMVPTSALALETPAATGSDTSIVQQLEEDTAASTDVTVDEEQTPAASEPQETESAEATAAPEATTAPEVTPAP